MPEPTDPYTFADGPGNTASGVQVNERFKRLYDTLKRSVTGIDWSNIAVGGIREDCMATAGNGLSKGSFSAYRNAALALATGGVVAFDTERYDPSGWFDVATGVYTPQVPGYYSFSALVWANAAIGADAWWMVRLQKFTAGAWANLHPGMLGWQRTVQAVSSLGAWESVEANGTTDAFRVIIEHSNGGATNIAVGPNPNFFQGRLVGRS